MTQVPLSLCVGGCARSPARAAPRPRAARGAPRAAPLSAAQQHYLVLASTASRSAQQRWRDPAAAGMTRACGDRDRYPLATIWDIVPLFESLDAIAIAQPTRRQPARRDALRRGRRALPEPRPAPVPGYSPYPGDRDANTETWFDDNGWWGLGVRERLPRDRHAPLAERRRARAALHRRRGWDPAAGGIWWNTDHPYKAGEALASGTLLATLLYQQTHSTLRARAGAQVPGVGEHAPASARPTACMRAAASNPTPIDYIEGPLIYAQALLCRLTARRRRLRSAPSS